MLTRSPEEEIPLITNENIGQSIRLVRREVKRWREPVMERTVKKKRDPFRVLIGCLLSLRTKDAVTDEASARLFARADTPESMIRLRAATIEKAIYPVGFYRNKTKQIRGICRVLLDEHGGEVPKSIDELVKLKGVGRKTANLVVTRGHDLPGICVDIHVHRISNRWGYVKTKNPDATEAALREKLPRRHWKSFNGMLVTYGQNLCRPVSPFCSHCPLAHLCAQTDVDRHRQTRWIKGQAGASELPLGSQRRARRVRPLLVARLTPLGCALPRSRPSRPRPIAKSMRIYGHAGKRWAGGRSRKGARRGPHSPRCVVTAAPECPRSFSTSACVVRCCPGPAGYRAPLRRPALPLTPPSNIRSGPRALLRRPGHQWRPGRSKIYPRVR